MSVPPARTPAQKTPAFRSRLVPDLCHILAVRMSPGDAWNACPAQIRLVAPANTTLARSSPEPTTRRRPWVWDDGAASGVRRELGLWADAETVDPAVHD